MSSLPTIVDYFNTMIYPRHPQLGYFTGSNKVVCPFHEDLNPSMGIIPGTEVFHCFGCQATGDVIEMHRRYLNQYHGTHFDRSGALDDLIDTFDLDYEPPSPQSRVSALLSAARSHPSTPTFINSLASVSDKKTWSELILRYTHD